MTCDNMMMMMVVVVVVVVVVVMVMRKMMVGWLEFNVPFQHKYGYIRDEGR